MEGGKIPVHQADEGIPRREYRDKDDRPLPFTGRHWHGQQSQSGQEHRPMSSIPTDFPNVSDPKTLRRFLLSFGFLHLLWLGSMSFCMEKRPQNTLPLTLNNKTMDYKLYKLCIFS